MLVTSAPTVNILPHSGTELLLRTADARNWQNAFSHAGTVSGLNQLRYEDSLVAAIGAPHGFRRH